MSICSKSFSLEEHKDYIPTSDMGEFEALIDGEIFFVDWIANTKPYGAKYSVDVLMNVRWEKDNHPYMFVSCSLQWEYEKFSRTYVYIPCCEVVAVSQEIRDKYPLIPTNVDAGYIDYLCYNYENKDIVKSFLHDVFEFEKEQGNVPVELATMLFEEFARAKA
jgi:hypothetical protein